MGSPRCCSSALKVGIFPVRIQVALYPAAHFDNIGGLKPRRRSRAGVVVRRVEQIRYDNERFQAEVVFTMDGRYKFPDRHHRQHPHLRLSGEQYLGLDPGGEAKTLAPGEVIKNPVGRCARKLISQFMFGKAEGDSHRPRRRLNRTTTETGGGLAASGKSHEEQHT